MMIRKNIMERMTEEGDSPVFLWNININVVNLKYCGAREILQESARTIG